MELVKGEHWLDRPLQKLKNIVETSKTREKTFKKQLSKQKNSKKVIKLLEKASKLLSSFLKIACDFRKEKKSKRNDFKNNMYLCLSQDLENEDISRQTTLSHSEYKKAEKTFAIIKKHLKHPSHCVAILLREFFAKF